jgi:hypothetical protein
MNDRVPAGTLEAKPARQAGQSRPGTPAVDSPLSGGTERSGYGPRGRPNRKRGLAGAPWPHPSQPLGLFSAMRSIPIRPAFALLIAGLLITAGGWLWAGPASDGASHASAVEAGFSPTPTFFSELGPAVMQSPRDAQLPSLGSAVRQTRAPRPKLAGLALALGGAVLVYTALRMRPENIA